VEKIIKSLIVSLLFASVIYGGDWQVDKSANNKVTFHSSTTLLDFQGNTDKIDGYIFWEGDKVFGDKNELYFEVALVTFETGIGKRDRDMREDVLHTEKFPLSSFKGNFSKVQKTGSGYKVTVKGELSLHGHKKEMELSGDITIKDGVMNVKTNFSIYLKDYKIEAPTLVAFIKVAEEIKLSLDFNLKEAE
jgi:polyisoprenoid-binding protein YceI